MAANTAIDSVATEDAAPVAAPHKLSRDAAHSTAHVTFHASPDLVALGPDTTLEVDAPTVTPDTDLAPDTTLEMTDGATPGDTAADLIGYTLRLGGASVDTGTDLGSKGACGALPVSTKRVCGAMRAAAGMPVTADVPASALVGADGPYTVNVYMQAERGGWS